MLTAYDRLPLVQQQRIDTRIFVGEVDRLGGDAVFRSDDPRAVDADLTLDERIAWLRNLYAEDITKPQPYYNWTHAKFDQIKLDRALRMQEKQFRSGKHELSLMDELVDKLSLPYLKPPVTIDL